MRFRRRSAIAIVATWMSASTARTTSAQTASSAPPSLASGSVAEPPSVNPAANGPQAPPPEVAEAARRLFREGAQLANQGHWEEARDRFRRALAVRASPLLRFNAALAAQNSGHLVEAIDQYRQFLLDDTDPANALRRQEAQTAITAIENVLARLVIEVSGSDPPTEIRLDDHVVPLALAGVEIPVDPSEHVIDAVGTHGSRARQVVRLGDGSQRRVTLVLNAASIVPASSTRPTTAESSGRPGSTAPASAAVPSRPHDDRAQAASAGTVERVRRAIEERASTADEFGRHRWERTTVFYAFQGLGNPDGLVGLGLRFAARPWIGFELQGGIGHPFGPGVGVFMTAGAPFSYRYGLGLIVGASANFTQINRPSGEAFPPCAASGAFTSVWFTAAIAHEWRTSLGFAFRFALGVRYLVNGDQLKTALMDHCAWPPTPFSSPADLFLDSPTLDRWGNPPLPVLPFISFDVGYGI